MVKIPLIVGNSTKKWDSAAILRLTNRLGHFPDTEENRQRIIELTNDESNFIGISGHGKRGYAKIVDDLQYWAFTRDGIIQDAGANKPGEYRSDNEILFGRRKNETG